MEIDGNTKFCQHCGTKIPYDAVICTTCGRQVAELKQTAVPQQQMPPQPPPQIYITNNNTAPVTSTNTNTNTNTNFNSNLNQNSNALMYGRRKNKYVALFLCIFFGYFGAHKFYEGKKGMGLLYMFTCGLFMIGLIIDLFSLLAKPNPYYV